MPINNITQTISELPAAGKRGIDVQTQFVIKQEDFQDHLQGTTVTELNTLKDQLNTRIGEINSTATTMNGYVNDAFMGSSTATTKAGEASTSATAALNSKNQASTFATNSSNSATKASQWADNNYNVEVETGRYSAKHWATVAQNFGGDTVKLTGNQTVDGIKTFSSKIVGNITGNSATATKLDVARTINGVAFDGSTNITVGDSTAVKLTNFTGANVNFGINGYQKLPSGLILQWGTSVSITNGGGGAAVFYPITFPTASFMPIISNGDNAAVLHNVSVIEGQVNKTGFGWVTEIANAHKRINWVVLGY